MDRRVVAQSLKRLNQHINDVVGTLGCIRDHQADGSVHEEAFFVGHAHHGFQCGPGSGCLGEQEAAGTTVVSIRCAPHAQE
jgi:hypothetical protein